MMQCSLHVNDNADCTADRLAHELFLCAHRRRPMLRSRNACGHLEILLLVHLPQPLDLLPQRLLMSCKTCKFPRS
uniref:Uncharacterized protein n=1 Tax=Arundo donax TaxID=35708 RepID=A0A0A9CZ16_ARUDO